MIVKSMLFMYSFLFKKDKAFFKILIELIFLLLFLVSGKYVPISSFDLAPKTAFAIAWSIKSPSECATI